MGQKAKKRMRRKKTQTRCNRKDVFDEYREGKPYCSRLLYGDFSAVKHFCSLTNFSACPVLHAVFLCLFGKASHRIHRSVNASVLQVTARVLWSSDFGQEAITWEAGGPEWSS